MHAVEKEIGRCSVEVTNDMVVPLSFQQIEMLRNFQRFPGCTRSYNRIFLFRLDGQVDLDCLSKAVKDLESRHSALRASIGWDGDSGVQQIRPFPADLVVTSSAHGNTVEDSIAQLDGQCFELDDIASGAPLFRAGIHAAGSAVFFWLTIHHLIYDEWSLGVLWRDLAEFYEASLHRREPLLPAMPLDYVDLVRRQRAAWPSTARRSLPFWRGILDGYQGGLQWPRPADGGCWPRHEMRNLRFSVPEGCMPTVRSLSRGGRASPFMVLLSATAVAMARVTGSADFLLGTDTSNRRDPSVMEMIGFLINTYVIRAQMKPGRSFPELVSAMRAAWLDADEHRDAYVDPVLQTFGAPELLLVEMASWQGAGRWRPVLPGLTMTPVPVQEDICHWRDLFVMWCHEPDGFHGNICYLPARVAAGAVAEIASETIAVLQDPWQKI